MAEGVRLCGLGVYPPEDVTLETLQVLDSCDVVFTDLIEDGMLEWLRGYFPGMRRTADAAEVVAAACSRASVGLAVWGHPQYTSTLARGVRRLCLKRSVPCRVFASNSPIGVAMAASVDFMGGAQGCEGVQAYDLDVLLDSPDGLKAQLPLVVYSQTGNADRWRRLGSLLARTYPMNHEARFLGPGNRQARCLPLKSLGCDEWTGTVLYLPARLPAAQALIPRDTHAIG